MNPRVYVLLDVMPGKPEEVVRSLRGKPGVIRADLLDGPPDIAVIFEALNSLELARVTIETLNAYEPVTEPTITTRAPAPLTSRRPADLPKFSEAIIEALT